MSSPSITHPPDNHHAYRQVSHVPHFLPVAAATLGFLTALWAGAKFAPTGDDSRDYTQLARNVAAGHGLSLMDGAPVQPFVFRAPVYPLFLGFIYRTLGSSPNAVLFAQALVYALGCAILIRLALVTFHRRVALITQVASHEYCRRAGQSSLSVRKQAYAFHRCLVVNIW